MSYALLSALGLAIFGIVWFAVLESIVTIACRKDEGHDARP